jgi:predicted nuclease of predicted toxin-antitoxin system
VALRDLGLRDADDRSIFEAARKEAAVLVSKDQDFVALVQRHGPPPKLIWLTCGNTSNDALRLLFRSALPAALRQLDEGDDIVEIG